MALAQSTCSSSRSTNGRTRCSFLSSRNLYKLLQKLLVVPLDLSLLDRLFVGVNALLVTEVSLLVVDGESLLRLLPTRVTTGNTLQFLLVNALGSTQKSQK